MRIILKYIHSDPYIYENCQIYFYFNNTNTHKTLITF